ncbi:MAG TPA: cytochrome c oxidase subunit 3 [Acidimicrobiales bacterium]|nr:cytochrome c oxidase subunit 3 [Acidimicrobiales bacterium]
MASPTLALPSAGGVRPRRVLTMAVLFLATGGGMLFAALLAAYLHMRRLADPFPPADAEIDQYWGNLMVLTMLMGTVTVEWACSALRREQRKEAIAGFGVTLALGLAFLNLMSFAAGHVEFDAVSHPYGLVVAAMTMLLGLVVGVCVAFVTLTMFRVAGRQLLEAGADQPRAAACAWHFATIASVAVWYTVIVLK